jgi:hypothetical protein
MRISLTLSWRWGLPVDTTIERPKSSFIAKKIEYLCHTLTKRADSFIVDKGMFIAHIDKRNVDERTGAYRPWKMDPNDF